MVSKKIILDSNVWLAYFIEDDSQHDKAVVVFSNITETILMPEYVLLEVSTLLRSKKHNVKAVDFCRKMITNRETFLHSMPLVGETADTFCKRNDKLSFVDTALLVLSKEYTVITFDKALQKAIK